MEQLIDTIEMLKQEVMMLRDKQEDDYQLLNDRIDEICIKLS